MRLAEDCGSMNSTCLARYDEIDVMIKCADAAVQNLEISVKQLEPKHQELKKWVTPTLSEHEQLATKWAEYMNLARSTPISATMVNFMTRGEVSKAEPTLEDLVELDTANKAGKLASTANRRFGEKAANLDKAAKQMYQGLDRLISDFDRLMNRSALGHSTDSDQLLQDIEAIVRQIDADYRTALTYGNSQRDVAQASKTASNHTERLVPSLKKRAKEMDELMQYSTRARNEIALESVAIMRTITDITSLHIDVRSQINGLNQAEDDMTTFDYLRLIQQLPYVYASFLVEAVRRREWSDRVKTDSSTLANEMALFQDEELKRRKKWQKLIGSMYGPSHDTNVMGLEVNLQGEDSTWPVVSREELDDFAASLQSQNIDAKILEDISKLIQELHNPTKQQSKRLKAFKNGSIHDTALGRSGLMIRGDEELLRSLQEDKGKLESKLKTAESRVRRLEDLLHRQSQATQPGKLFQPQSDQTRRRNNSGSSAKSNKFESHQRSSDGADPLLRRIAQLETELSEEKLRSARLEQELRIRTTEHAGMKDRLDELNSTKKDLLENMEALKREFVDERKSLEDEIKAMKTRLEDTEDEMENFGESREHEKASHDEKVRNLEAEIDRLTRERKDEAIKAQGQADFLRRETRMLRERLDSTDREIQAAQEENRRAQKELQAGKELVEELLHAMVKLHRELAPDVSVPTEALDMAESLLSRAADLRAHAKDGEADTWLLKADLDHAHTLVKDLRAQVASTQEKLAAEEVSARHLRENSSEEKAKVQALEGEVSEAREQLSHLRATMFDGQAGSETLRQRLDLEEARVVSLTEEIASRQSQVGSLEEELRTYKDKLETVQSQQANARRKYGLRDERTKELSQKLYSQNDRLTRLLERIGYAVSRKDGTMAIEKIPRAERPMHNPNDSSDPGSYIRRSATLASRVLSDSTELELLYWMDDADIAAESAQFASFMEKLGSFDMDVFADTVYRRIKETEHKARKWQRDARSYRDLAHNAQRDGQEKIAFKHFKEGDLALFLPTRNQQAGAWAAFNVGFPHYFLREQDAHRLRHREWLVARIQRIQERVVDLSKSLEPSSATGSAKGDESDNPFQLSDGLRWYLIDAHEDKPGAPSTPGMGKSTVAANHVEATAKIQARGTGSKGKNRDSVTSIEGINKSLSKSLESRRSSSGSKKASPFHISGGAGLLKSSALSSETNSLRAAAQEGPAATSPAQEALPAAGSTGPAGRRQSDGQGDGASATVPRAHNHGEDGSAAVHEAGEAAARGSGLEGAEVRNNDS